MAATVVELAFTTEPIEGYDEIMVTWTTPNVVLPEGTPAVNIVKAGATLSGRAPEEAAEDTRAGVRESIVSDLNNLGIGEFV